MLIGFAGFVFTSLILYFPFVLIGGPALAMYCYSKHSAKWQIWAFENVRNVHELKQRARNSGLMKEDGTPLFFNWGVSTADREKWDSLQVKFNRPDVFADDPLVPPETVVYYSKTKKYLTLLFYLPIAGLGIVIMFIPGSGTYLYIWGAFLIILGVSLFYLTIRDANNKKPQIILNNEGMSTVESPFHTWLLIRDEKTEISKSGRLRSIYLSYQYPGGSIKFMLDGFTVGRGKLEQLMRIYRGRAHQKTNRTTPH